ncbi:50S ribosomal protein L14 [candidate division WWE3 bacterium]|jgi:large subunit ribosomal protein L14|nr:50S ribosomal protein L14 [candidate division WWE3 bacterium]MBT7349533.1 50S ribosomal protein L14 [candidate division WWE3 bacterium]
MIPVGAVLKVADNSGAKRLKLIGIPGSNKKTVSVGDELTGVVHGASSVGNVKDHSVVRAVLVRVRKEVRRKDGTYIRFDDNAAVVVDKDKNMLGTRIFGPVAREVRSTGYMKIASLAPEVW